MSAVKRDLDDIVTWSLRSPDGITIARAGMSGFDARCCNQLMAPLGYEWIEETEVGEEPYYGE